MGDAKQFVIDLKKDFEFENDKGSLIQLVNSGYSQVNVVCSYANTVRGGHMHKIAREAFYVIEGCLKIRLWSKDEVQIKEYKKGDFFEIQPKVMHSLEFMDDCIMVALYDIPIEKGNGMKDIYTEEEC